MGAKNRMYPIKNNGIPKKFFYRTILVNPKKLLPHEEVTVKSLHMVISLIKAYDGFRFPILIDGNSLTILDGHHRVEAARILGLKFIPVFPVDYYFDNNVLVFPRRKEFMITKKIIIEKALRGELFPPKTTRHVVKRIVFPSSIISLQIVNNYNKKINNKYPIID